MHFKRVGYCKLLDEDAEMHVEESDLVSRKERSISSSGQGAIKL